MTIPASQNQFPRVLFASGDDSAPASGLLSIYQKADGQIYGKNSAGEEKLLIMASIGALFSPATGDFIYALQYTPENGYIFGNAPFSTLVSNQLIGVLAAYPGFGASKRLASNSTADGFEWVDP